MFTGLSFDVNACFASKHKMLDREEAAPSDNLIGLLDLIGRTPLVGCLFLDFIPVEHNGSFGDFLLRHVIPDSPHKLHTAARFQHHANEWRATRCPVFPKSNAMLPECIAQLSLTWTMNGRCRIDGYFGIAELAALSPE